MSVDGPFRLLELPGWPWLLGSSAAGLLVGAVVGRWSLLGAGVLLTLALAVLFFGQLGGFDGSDNYFLVFHGSLGHLDGRSPVAVVAASMLLSMTIVGPAVAASAVGVAARKLITRRSGSRTA